MSDWPPVSASNPRWIRLALLLGSGGLLLAGLACDTGPQPPEERVGLFSPSDSAYIVTGATARLAEDDQRVALGVVMDVAKTDAGYVIADISNDRLVFLDTGLNPVAMAGGTGDGPGEFRGPYRLLTHADTVVALDLRGRVSYLRPDGRFLRVDEGVPGIVGGFPKGEENRGGSRGPDSGLESGSENPNRRPPR